MAPGEFRTVLQSAGDPESIRKWAPQQIESTAMERDSPIGVSQLPNELKQAGAGGGWIGPFASIGGTDGQRFVRVYRVDSSGIGPGILIGNTNLTLPTSRFCLRWVPGIYFIDPHYR
jgi:hypothetical protein